MYHSKKTVTTALDFYSYKYDPILLIIFVNIILNKISILSVASSYSCVWFLPAVLTLSQICSTIHESLLPKFNTLYLTLLSFISLKTTLHSCPSLQFLFPQVGVILKSDDHALCSIISAIKHNLETANDSDPHTTTLQCPWRVSVNPWLTLVKRASSVSHAPTFTDCICGIFVYCGYKNLKWNSTKSLTKIKINHTNPLQPQDWLPCQRKEVGWFDGMCYLQDSAGCFYSLLSSISILSVDRSWADGYVISWIHLFSAF